MSRFTFVALVACLLFSAEMTQATPLHDPMRPSPIKRIAHGASNIPTGKISVKQEKKWSLSAITYMPDAASRSAIVNGRRVRQGSRVAGATIQIIDSNSVKLKRDGKSITLRLIPQIKTVPED